jgi:excisionase family DNA binding protein
MQKDFLSVLELAYELNVHPNTIYKAVRSGRIHAFRITDSSKSAWRIPRTEITRLATLEFKLLETLK